jgi:hypothetical protein
MKKHRLLIMAIAISSGFGVASNALAQAPAMHFGSDFRPKTLARCINHAKFAMQRNNAGQLRMTQSGNAVFGTGPDVSVVVTCTEVNGGVVIQVVAASPDSSIAERYRNEVRIVAFDAKDFDR